MFPTSLSGTASISERSDLLRIARLQPFHNGTYVQAALISSDSARPRQGPLAPSCFQDLLATMGLSDSRLRQMTRLFIPAYPVVPTPHRRGSPRFLGPSFRARLPLSPRGALQVPTPVASLQMSGLAISGRLATPTLRNEAESGSLALRLTRSQSGAIHPFVTRFSPSYRSASYAQLPSRRGPPLHGERAITMTDSFQSARYTRLGLALQRHGGHRGKSSFCKSGGADLQKNLSCLRCIF
jgi:hypothetical protein